MGSRMSRLIVLPIRQQQNPIYIHSKAQLLRTLQQGAKGRHGKDTGQQVGFLHSLGIIATIVHGSARGYGVSDHVRNH